MKEEEKKFAVVTGGTSGIGLSIVKVLEKYNFSVFVLSLDNPDNKENVFICDISKKEEVEKAFESIKSQVPKIDVLVNNAGFGMSGALELATENEIRKIFDVNVFGMIFVSQCALPLMNEGAKIFNMASMMGVCPMPYRSLYAATKSAAATLSYCMAMELSHAKIKVCTINPGDIKTNFTKSRVKNFKTNIRYGDHIEKNTLRVDSREGKRLPPEAVSKAFEKQLKRKNPKFMIIVGGKHKWFNFAKHIVPLSWFACCTNKLFNK